MRADRRGPAAPGPTSPSTGLGASNPLRVRHSSARTGILGAVRAAVRLSLVLMGTVIVVLAITNLVETVVDGGRLRIAWAAVESVLLGGVGCVVARAGVRYDNPDGSA